MMDRGTLIAGLCGVAACLPLLAYLTLASWWRRDRILTGLLAPFAALSGAAWLALATIA